MKKIYTLLTAIILLSSNVRGQTPAYTWAYNVGSNQGEEPTGHVTDNAGNLIITGWFQLTADFDPGPGVANLTAPGGRDIFVAKYNSSGAYVWAFMIGSATSTDQTEGITVDASNNIYITGLFTGTVDFDPGPGTANLVSPNTNTFVAKYNSAGAYQWAFPIIGASYSGGQAIKFDNSGSVVVTGHFEGSNIDFDPGPGTALLTSSGGTYDVFIAKYDASGNYVWANAVGGNGDDIPQKLSVDLSGNVVIHGTFQQTVDFDPGPGVAPRTSIGSDDNFLAKYSSTGTFLWVFAYGLPSQDGSGGIATDASGNIYLSGSFGGTIDFDPGPGVANLTPISGSDIYVAKYDGSGNYLWGFVVSGNGGGGDHTLDCAVDAVGNVLLIGYFTGTIDLDPGPGVASFSALGGSLDMFLAKYSGAGTYMWGFRIGSVQTDWGVSISETASNEIFMTGYLVNTADFDPGPGTANLTSNGVTFSDPCFAKYFVCSVAPSQPGTITGPTTVCQGTTNTYSIAPVSGATSYTWVLPGGWTGTSTTTSINATASATSGNITVTANNSCGSSTAQTLAVTVNATPTVSNAGPDQNICATTATLAGNTPVTGTGLWTLIAGTGTITTPTSFNSGLTGLGVGTNTFRWTISNGVCTPSFDNVNIIVSATPTTSNAGTDQSICATTATLAGNTPVTGTGVWTLVSGAATITTPTSPTSGLTGIGVGANTLRWTISNGSCTPSTDDVVITRSTNPTVSNAGPDQNICATTATLAGNTPVTGTGLWTLIAGTGTITTPTSPTSGLTALGVGTNTFRWTISNGACTPSTDDVNIIVSANPTTANAGTDQTICATTATLAGNTPVTGTGMWTLVSGTATITTPTSPTSGLTGIGVGANTLRWTITNGSCTPSFDDVIITRDANPTIANAGTDQTICATTATLAGNTPVTGTGAWTLISGAATITTPSSPTSGLTGIGVGANTLRWTISNGSCTPSFDDVIITRDANPTTANAGTDQTICATTATLAGNSPTTGTGLWTLISGTATITTPTSPTSGLTGIGVGANTLRWTISNGSCTPSFDDVVITRDANPTTANAGTDQTICATTATLAGNSPTTGTGLWTLISGTATITTPTSPTSGLTGIGVGANTLRWTISNGSCTPSFDDVIITRDANPTTANAGVDQTICSSTATLAGNTPVTGTGLWTLVSGVATITTPTSPISGLTGIGVGTNTLRWTISNGSCAPSFDDVVITLYTVGVTTSFTSNLCNGDNTGTATATPTGTGPFTYLWSNAQTTATATGLVANTYTVTVTGAAGCTATTTVIVTEPTALSFNATVFSNALCFGDCNGSVTLNATGGTSPYTYSPSPNNLCAGTYTFTVTDANGCTAQSTATITQPTALSVSTNTTFTTCGTCCDGSATATATGGSPGYSYLWMPGGQTTMIATGLCVGIYTVCITDLNGCTTCATASVTFNVGIQPTANENEIIIYPNPVNNILTVISSDARNLLIYNVLGEMIYETQIQNPTTEIDLSKVPSGVYFINIESDKGIVIKRIIKQ